MTSTKVTCLLPRAAFRAGTFAAVALIGTSAASGLHSSVSASAPIQPVVGHHHTESTVGVMSIPVRLIVFAADDAAGNSFIYSMRYDGSKIRQLTSGRGAIEDQEPTFSPNRKWILFIRVRGVCRATCPHEGIYEMSSAGRNLHKVASGAYAWPAVSPKGHRIAAIAGSADRSRIVIMSRSGGSTRTLNLHGLRQPDSVAWSPKGSQLIFSALTRNDNREIFVAHVDGSHQRQITHDKQIQESPVWSPDGDSIVFSQSRTWQGPWHLHSVSLQTSKMRQLTFGRVSASYPHFRSDGRAILYQRGITKARAYIIQPSGFHNHPVSTTVTATEPNW